MARISLIPTRTPDGRHIIFKARVESNRERLLAAVRRAFRRQQAALQGS
jgi:transcriptional/translational regulatory protein YebC/TACO1